MDVESIMLSENNTLKWSNSTYKNTKFGTFFWMEITIKTHLKVSN